MLSVPKPNHNSSSHFPIYGQRLTAHMTQRNSCELHDQLSVGCRMITCFALKMAGGIFLVLSPIHRFSVDGILRVKKCSVPG